MKAESLRDEGLLRQMKVGRVRLFANWEFLDLLARSEPLEQLSAESLSARSGTMAPWH